MDHYTTLVNRPPVEGARHGMVKPLCSCGWQGGNHRAQADAEKEAADHIASDPLASVRLEEIIKWGI